MVNGINHITISVKDIDSAFTFYKNVLELTPIMKSKRSAYFTAGQVWIALDERPNYEKSDNYAHICFNVPKEKYLHFIEKIKQNNITEWQSNQTEGNSLYLYDDSGNKLEIHFSTLSERIEYGKQHFGTDVEWFI
ncbi:VOC family protein [Breznakiella homolactica]|uniref:VOC family protein n=1 Tax=Breznakiella homolactica TaxID=2798577 RepID=A0A7T8BCL3_9SPIR|nr:VOC family protein [Breznakiella homolactica]QQO10383.1 VOC family protein [Breznakiella homolactica]